jgi:hypothetical protein
MRTLVAMVSVGDRDHLTNVTYRRLYRWASSKNYDCFLAKKDLTGGRRGPNFSKLKIPDRIPGYDRYCIVDDDLLMSTDAPSLPHLQSGHVGLCRDALQNQTNHPAVEWTGNTGFILVGDDALDLLNRAYENGGESKIWPPGGDQSALNLVAWEEDRVQELDGRWNTQPVLSYFHNGLGWDKWKTSKSYRLSFYVSLALRLPGRARDLVEKSWGLHMVRGLHPKFFDHILD